MYSGELYVVFLVDGYFFFVYGLFGLHEDRDKLLGQVKESRHL